MTRPELASLLNSYPETTASYPFGPDAEVFKVAGKMFALIGEGDRALQVNLKCEPALAEQLRQRFDAVIPGYHMNKKHWNTVLLAGDVDDEELRLMVEHSYRRVVKGMKRADRERLQASMA